MGSTTQTQRWRSVAFGFAAGVAMLGLTTLVDASRLELFPAIVTGVTSALAVRPDTARQELLPRAALVGLGLIGVPALTWILAHDAWPAGPISWTAFALSLAIPLSALTVGVWRYRRR